MHKILYRPIVVISLVLGMLVMIELLALGRITWSNLHRIDRIKQDIVQGHDLEQLTFDLLTAPRSSEAEKTAVLKNLDLYKKFIDLIANSDAVKNVENKNSPLLLAQTKTILQDLEQGKSHELAQILTISQNLLNLQRANEEKLLTQVYQDSRLELNFAVIIPLAVLLPAFALSFLVFRNRILSPLTALEQLLARLTKGEMQPIEEKDEEKIRDPIMQPLFNSYNRLIRRLIELEEEHITHTQTLEREVRNATHTLLEQSHTLARSERLAAVGELAASAAHELRNPLAGIQAALENMHGDCRDPELLERLTLVNVEVKRLTGRLNDLLAYSKQPPETARLVNIAQLVNELLTLLRYQINENIELKYFVPANLQLTLPETEFRQALLNLLLNSIKELGSKGGGIQISVYPKNEHLNVEVSDSGPGFPKNIIEQGVRPFVSYHEHGTGLGLSMVLRFARSLGGQLLLKNDSQGHACATLILPMPI